jgi:hypothetical protein
MRRLNIRNCMLASIPRIQLSYKFYIHAVYEVEIKAVILDRILLEILQHLNHSL